MKLPATNAAIAALIPHGGAMVLLERVLAWDATGIACAAVSHLDPANPLRSQGRLAAVCGVEYALQAAALHGALSGGAAQPAGQLASLRAVGLHVEFLDDPAYATLHVAARMLRQEAGGLVFDFTVAAGGKTLLDGRAAIALPA